MILLSNSLTRTMLIVSIYSAAMAFVESAVVIYLRMIYYPSGFNFPLNLIEKNVGMVEFSREIATIVMLLSLSYLVGKNLNQRFAWFLWSFALWDICYYVFLKVLIQWPIDFFTWDVLFLIPLVWVGPVIAPVILALLMMLLAFAILRFDQIGRARLSTREWSLLIVGSLISITSFMYEHLVLLVQNLKHSGGLFDMENIWPFNASPEKFVWGIFIPGSLLILSGIIHFIYRQSKIRKNAIRQQWI